MTQTPTASDQSHRSLFRMPAGWIFIAGLIVAGIWSYHNSFAGAMVFDDLSNILEDPFVYRFGPWRDLLSSHRPLLRLTFALNYAAGGLDVRGYHLVNLLVHLCAGLALFGVVRRTFLSPRLRHLYKPQHTDALAFVIALLWLVHPLHTGSVTYIVQRAESMMAMMYLVCLYGVIRGAQSPHGWRWYGVSIAAFTLGIAIKEIIATAPVVILLYDRIFLSKSWREVFRRRWTVYLIPFLPGLIWLSINVLPSLLPALRTSPGDSPLMASAGLNVPGLTPFGYARTQPGVVLHYLRLAFWPHPLCLDYEWPGVRSASEVIVPALLIGLLLGGTVWALIRRPALGFLGAAFFVILAPTSSVIPLRDLAFEHRMYLPLAPVVALVVLAAWDGLNRLFIRIHLRPRPRGMIQAALVFSLAATLSMGTIARNEAYRTPIAIWSSVLDLYPNNHRALVNLGNAYARAGKPEQALPLYQKAMRLRSDDPRNLYNLGYALQDMNQDEAARQVYLQTLNLKPYNILTAKTYNQLGLLALKGNETGQATAFFNAAIQLNRSFAIAHSNLAGLYLQTGQLKAAYDQLTQAIQYRPDLPVAHYQLGMVLERQGRLPEAAASYTKALKYDPQQAEVSRRLRHIRSDEQHALGLTLVEQNRVQEAATAFAAAIALDPDHHVAHNNLGNVLLMQGRPREAIQHYRESLRLQPDQPEPLSNLAWIFATHPDSALRNPDEAVRLADRACALTEPMDPRLLDTRAAAYAAVGQFDRAVADMQRVIQLASAQAERSALEKYRLRLKRYRAHQPYREPR